MAFYDQTITIANGQTTTDAVDTGLLSTHGKTQLVGISFPAAMTSTAMTFTAASTSGGTYTTVKEVGGASNYSITVSTSSRIPLDPRVFVCCPFIKCVGGSSEGGARTLTLHFREVQ